jgi:hypothetical protein
MTDTAERRPGRGGVPDAANVNVMVNLDLRRRRDAAWRLPPLDDGTRDPIDALAGKPIPQRPIECPGMFGDNGKWKPCCGRGAA